MNPVMLARPFGQITKTIRFRSKANNSRLADMHSQALPRVTMFTDGAASPNPGPGGYAVILIQNAQRQEITGGFRQTTNNRMELMGAIVGLRALNGKRSAVALHSDSKYVVDMFMGGYAVRWRNSGWCRGKGRDPVRNPDLWAELLVLAEQHDVRMEWVRGHADNAANTRCDELAVQARQVRDLPADTGYEALAAGTIPLVRSAPSLQSSSASGGAAQLELAWHNTVNPSESIAAAERPLPEGEGWGGGV